MSKGKQEVGGASSLRADRATDASHGAPDGSPPSGSVSTSAGHTPGPWDADFDSGSISHDGHQIASVWVPRRPGVQAPLAEREANARLIAAAPELLEALEALLEAARLTHESWDTDDAWRIWRDAEEDAERLIARARGETA